MIRTLLLVFLIVGATALAKGQSAIGLLPQDKKPEVVEDSELNPFGIRTKQGTAAVVVVESEETRVRAALAHMAVGGLTRSYGVTKVLLGSLMVEAGETLPDVIPGQTEKVRVMAVNDNQIELGFVEKDGAVGERKILMGVDLEPVVRYRLPPPSTPRKETVFDATYKDHGTRLPTD